ncbi:MAG TPA: heparinase II/III family protein [Puia sp.]|nr:heparinase II/III family protein [Puia sp.]
MRSVLQPLRWLAISFIPLCLAAVTRAQPIRLPATFSQQHPRMEIARADLPRLREWIDHNELARNTIQRMRQSIAPYIAHCRTDSTWMLSRLQMYWQTRHVEIYINGGIFDHAEGQAPVPTVKFPGARDNITLYAAPKPEDLLPYSDDLRGVCLVNRSKPGQPMEWVEVAKTGRVIESINTQLMGMAYTAAWLYRLTGEEEYARFAIGLFDTYMKGMYYRTTPHDITHGHHETIAGLSTFEVIQEAALLNNLTGIYDLLYDYLRQHIPQQLPLYTNVFRKWADVQIDHGVAFNNWDLIEARSVLNIASVLEDDKTYPDGKGRQYYIDFILNHNAERQWSLTKLLQEGYDPVTGIWNECPGYSLNVLADFTGIVQRFDRQFHHDILPDMPILEKAVPAAAQYLFPNGFFTAFGDSHYGRLSSIPARRLLENAQLHHKSEQAVFARYAKTLDAFNNLTSQTSQYQAGQIIQPGPGFNFSEIISLLPDSPYIPQPPDTTHAGQITDYITPVFSAPRVSYLAIRNGFDPVNGLMVALSGSKGNHMHAGGIAMELFGKGMILAPEAGIGASYFQPDYAEYYSQFPAHNTVAVDGISAYPVMKSNHGFDLLHSYPAPGVKEGFFPLVSFANVSFIEPETQASQNRLIAIIRTSDSSGYYIDVFRSARKDGRDKMHDYFYHNMGQQLTLIDSAGLPLTLQPTDQLTFAGGHLPAYDYFWDKRSVFTSNDIQAVFRLNMPHGPGLQMNMWMKGEKDREIFAVKAPASRAIDRMGLPHEIAALPLPTIIARQKGEAWNRPFTVVFEPSVTDAPKEISAIHSFTPVRPVGSPDRSVKSSVCLTITTHHGNKQWIFCSADTTTTRYDRYWSAGVFGMISEGQHGLQYLFIGDGSGIGRGDYSITSSGSNVSAALCRQPDGWYFTATGPVTVTLPQQDAPAGKSPRSNGSRVVLTLPAMPYSKLQF